MNHVNLMANWQEIAFLEDASKHHMSFLFKVLNSFRELIKKKFWEIKKAFVTFYLYLSSKHPRHTARITNEYKVHFVKQKSLWILILMGLLPKINKPNEINGFLIRKE